MTWAPDAIWDATQNAYRVYWTSALSDGWFIMSSFTTDFQTFTTAEKWLTGAGMDVTIALDDSTGTYYRISKNGAGELIEEAKASSLMGTWTVVKDQIGSGAMSAGEGPLIFQDTEDKSKVSVCCLAKSDWARCLSVLGRFADKIFKLRSGTSGSTTTPKAADTCRSKRRTSPLGLGLHRRVTACRRGIGMDT